MAYTIGCASTGGRSVLDGWMDGWIVMVKDWMDGGEVKKSEFYLIASLTNLDLMLS